jgi:hypothetical protein
MMGTNTVNVKCELTIDDAIAWNNYYLENSPQWKTNWKLIRFVFMPVMIICFLAGIIYLYISISRGLFLSSLIASAIGIIIGGGGFLYYYFYPAILHRRIRKSAHKAYSYRNTFVGTHQYTVSPEGVRDNDEAIVKWTAVEDIVQTDKHVFILVHPKKAVIIPKKAFHDEAATNRFVQSVTAIFKSTQKTE